MPAPYQFEDFQLDVVRYELRRNGHALKLEKLPMELLILLVGRHGELVSREEIVAKLWRQDVFIETEHGINTAVRKIRQALGDNPEHSRFVQTVVGKGYRFIANVSYGDSEDTEPANGQQENNPQAEISRANGGAATNALPGVALRANRASAGSFLTNSQSAVLHGNSKTLATWASARSLYGMTSLVLLLAIAGLFASNLAGIRWLFPHNPPPREIHSLAVLPLINISADPEQEYFVDGMTEQLIKELSQLNSLRVPSRTSVMRYKGEKRKNVSEIARELGVDAVVEGSVVRAGHRVRITAQVIEAATERHLLSESYEPDLGDILKLQREVAEAITQQVRVKLTPEQIHRLHEPREVDPEAYEAYLKALSFDRTRHREIQRAQSYLEKAIQKQPDFTQAYVELARSYRNLGQFGWLAPHRVSASEGSDPQSAGSGRGQLRSSLVSGMAELAV